MLQITTRNIVDQSILSDVEIKVDHKVIGRTNGKGIIIIQNLDFK